MTGEIKVVNGGELSSFTTLPGDHFTYNYGSENVLMDLADASLVVVAESRGYRRLFTIDSDFYIYRLADGSVLEVVR